MAQKSFGNYRLSRGMIDTLSDIKLAFEICYVKHITNDVLMQKLIDCIEDGDPAVWSTYMEILTKKENQ